MSQYSNDSDKPGTPDFTVASLGDAYNADVSLHHGSHCICNSCSKEPKAKFSTHGPMDKFSTNESGAPLANEEAMLDRAIENAVVRGIFQQSDLSRRSFLNAVGGSTLAAIIGSLLPLDAVKAAVKETTGQLEKTKLKVGFVPITCATPIIMAHPLGFYSKYGLDVEVIKTAGWAVARDKSLAMEYDASHMLTPMPLAMTMGAGSTAKPFIMPAVENINGQAIVLHMDHKDKRDPKQWKGFKFGVPFDYSMHNFLLRYLSRNTVSTPIKTSRFVLYHHRKWSPICARETSTAISRPIRSTNARCGKRSALFTP